MIELNVIDNDTIQSNLSIKESKNTNYDFPIVCVFINKDNEIVDIYRSDNYNKLLDKYNSFSKILDCKKFVKPLGFNNRQALGGRSGLSTFSPIHFKLTENTVKKVINSSKSMPEKLKKWDQHLNDLKKWYPIFYTKNINLVKKIEDFFKTTTIVSDIEDKSKYKLELNISNNIFSSFVSINDYLIFIKKGFDIESFINEFNNFVKSRYNHKLENLYRGKGLCTICGQNSSLYLLEKGNFESFQGKHIQLYHSRNLTTKSKQEYMGVCKNCFKKFFNMFVIFEQNKIYQLVLPTTKDSKNIAKFKQLYFSEEKKDKSLLNKLKYISAIDSFDYILFQFKDYNRDDFTYFCVNNFNFNLPKISFNQRNLFQSLKFNLKKVNNKDIYEKIDYIPKERYTKKDFIIDLKYFFKGSFYENYLYLNYDLAKVDNPHKKYLLYKYKKSLFDFIFFEKNYFFSDFLFDYLLKDLIKVLIKSKEFKDYYSNSNLHLLLLKYYKINLIVKGDDCVIVKNLKQIENKLDDFINEFKNKEKTDKIILELENDYEASYIIGQFFYYIFNQTNSTKSNLEQLSRVLINVYSTEDLLTNLNKLCLKYSYNLRSGRFFDIIYNSLLKYSFCNNKIDDHLIAILTGFTSSKNIFYIKLKNKGDKE